MSSVAIRCRKNVMHSTAGEQGHDDSTVRQVFAFLQIIIYTIPYKSSPTTPPLKTAIGES